MSIRERAANPVRVGRGCRGEYVVTSLESAMMLSLRCRLKMGQTSLESAPPHGPYTHTMIHPSHSISHSFHNAPIP